MSHEENVGSVDAILARLRELGVSEFLITALSDLCEDAGQAQEDVDALQKRVELLKLKTRAGEKAIRFHAERAIVPGEDVISFNNWVYKDITKAITLEPQSAREPDHES